MTKKQKKTLKRILAALVLTVLLAVVFHFTALPWFVQLALWLVPYFIIGHDVLRKAFMGIKSGEVFDENFLMAVATVGAMGCGEYAEGVAVMLFYQIGELFQSYAVGKSRSSISALMDIRPDSANLEAADGGVSVVDPDDVAIGSTIVVKPGEKIPLDGVVLTGESTLNTAALTGESRPRTVRPGDEVISGCVNADAVLRIRTTKLYGESTVAKILDLVENSSLKKAPVENFITKFARYYTPAVCMAALVLAVVPPLFLGGWLDWIMRALTFLVISCPCALVISIPLTFFGGIGGASKCGILVKGGNYLEALSKTSIAVFDKTGTLTKGVFKVTQVIPINGKAYDLQMMEYAALAESVSNHPIAKSIQRACPDLDPRRVTEAKEIAGQGVKAKVDGHWVLAGNKKLMDAENVNMYQNGEGDGKFGTVVYIAVDGKFRGLLVISDEVKPTSKQAIIQLIVQGVHTVMLTGDSPRVGEYVAKELGVQEVLAVFEKSYLNHTAPLNVSEAHFVQNENGSITAKVTITSGGSTTPCTATGNGRLDAVATAIEQQTGMHFTLVHYSEHALDADTNARACSYVGLKWASGEETWGCGTHTDIIVAGIKALVSAINNK